MSTGPEMRILYIAPLQYGSTALHRMEALRQLGHIVDPIDTWPRDTRLENTARYRVLNRLGFPPDTSQANRRMLEQALSADHDVLWIDKGRIIRRSTLLRIRRERPRCVFVTYSPDDMMNPRNQSRHWSASVPLHDLHVTTKTYNVGELRGIGARRVLFVGNGYDPATHRPIPLSPSERMEWGADVGFTGAFERDRFERMLVIARGGVQVRVRGPQWEPWTRSHAQLDVRPGDVMGDNYARTICATRINLCFLRKVNRDRQTTRSVEIPACEGFMLGERTDEHLALFEEGREAEFFASDEELLSKVRYYLEHDEERRRIAEAGRRRCLRSGYSNVEQMKKVVDRIREIAAS